MGDYLSVDFVKPIPDSELCPNCRSTLSECDSSGCGQRRSSGWRTRDALMELSTSLTEMRQQVTEIHTFLMEFGKQMEGLGNHPALKVLLGGQSSGLFGRRKEKT